MARAHAMGTYPPGIGASGERGRIMSADYCPRHHLHTCHCDRPRVDPWTNQRVDKITYGVTFAGLLIRRIPTR